MALINCPGCGNPVSDKAATCPKCNYSFENQGGNLCNTIKCEDCGTEFRINLSACPACGCPVPEKVTKKGNIKGKIVALLLLVLIIVCGAKYEKKIKIARYENTMTDAVQTMLDGAVKAENVGNLVKGVWSNAIFKRQDEKTDKYTMNNGRFVDNFDDALENLFADDEHCMNVSEIRENQNEVTKLMRNLKNPPNEHKEAYSALKKFYDNYIKLTNSVVNPTGSLNSFSDEFNKYDTETINAYEKMKLYLE